MSREVCIDHKLIDKEPVLFSETVSDERDEVRVAYLAKHQQLDPKLVKFLH